MAISAFTSNLRLVLYRVQSGERIALTQRGKPVAVLVPVAPAAPPGDSASAPEVEHG